MGESNVIGKIIFQQASLKCIYFTKKEISVSLPTWALLAILCAPSHLRFTWRAKVLRNWNQWLASFCDSHGIRLCHLLRVRIRNLDQVNLRGRHFVMRVQEGVLGAFVMDLEYLLVFQLPPYYSFPGVGGCMVSKKYSFFKRPINFKNTKLIVRNKNCEWRKK